MYLPTMIADDGIRKAQTINFGGYNHTLAAKNGMIYDETNITSDYFPVLSPRSPRYLQSTLSAPNGLYCNDGIYTVDGTDFKVNGETKGQVDNNRKTFASLGRYIVILPDKKYYDTVSGVLGDIESSVPVSATFTDGTYAEEAAEGNTIRAASATFDWSDYFKVGDAVAISGSSVSDNNKTIIVREIAGRDLRFYPNSFTTTSTAETLTLKRGMPDMDFICENENRLWGCTNSEENEIWDEATKQYITVKSRVIYACKLGDIFNWNVFDGLSTDSYAVGVGSDGDFTGCCAYLGYPCFFKEEHIYKVYGDKPSNFQVMGSASLGTAAGAERSFGIAGETLFYLSRTGIVAYNGGIPSNISASFGTERYTDAVGGSDGVKYYVSMKDTANAWHMFVYDTRYGIWCREDGLHVLDFGWNTELYFLDSTGNLWMNGNARTPAGTAEASVSSSVEFADLTEDVGNSPRYGANKKHIAKLQIRMELDANASVTVQMEFDDGTWETVKTLTTATKRSYYLPIIPRRTDHFRIKLIGSGNWKLYSLIREVSTGSEN